MFARIADLTWKHPKLVLAAVGVFAVVAVAVGKDVEHHLKAAGFTDPASESEQAKVLLSDALGYDPNPAIVLVVRAPGGGRLDLAAPPCGARSTGSAARCARVDGRRPGRQPAARPPRRRRADRRGRRLARPPRRPLDGDLEDAGGIVAEDVEPLVAESSALDVSMGGYAPELQRGQRPDQKGPDQGRADRLPDPRAPAPARLPRRGRRRRSRC